MKNNEDVLRETDLDQLDTLLKCDFCEDDCDESDLQKETDLGFLCPNCVNALISRGESITLEH